MRKQFDIKYRSQIESGKYKVETRDGRRVRIICWDAIGPSSIIGLFLTDDGGETTTQNRPDGRWCDDLSYESDYDLFIVTPEEEPTEFEKAIKRAFICAGCSSVSNGIVKDTASELLALAREELFANDTVLKEYAEVAREQGKAEALKDLPRWRKCADADRLNPYLIKPWIVRFDNDIITDSSIIHHGHYLCFADLEKLPGFKEDESHE